MTLKPIPQPTRWTEPYWEAAKKGKFIIQRCPNCSQHVFIPRMVCPNCFSADLEWVEASGRGKVYSFTTVVNNSPSAFSQDVPYTIAIVQLAEGPRMVTNLVGVEPDKVYCDMEVEVTFEKVNEEVVLPKFRPLKR